MGRPPAPTVTVRCAACGIPFQPARRDAKTCSDRCRQRAHRAKAVK